MSRPVIAALIGFGFLLTSGCSGPTNAQQQLGAIKNQHEMGGAELRACYASIASDPAYGAVHPRLAILSVDRTGPSLSQLADQSHISPHEVTQLHRFSDALGRCRQVALEKMVDKVPSWVAVVAEGYYAEKQILVQIASAEISFGEANSRLAANRRAYNARSRQMVENIKLGLRQSHHAEIQNRAKQVDEVRGVLRAIGRAGQEAYQNTYANRPIVTRCMGYAYAAQCITR